MARQKKPVEILSQTGITVVESEIVPEDEFEVRESTLQPMAAEGVGTFGPPSTDGVEFAPLPPEAQALLDATTTAVPPADAPAETLTRVPSIEDRRRGLGLPVFRHWYESQESELDRCYYERNALVAALSKLFPARIWTHPEPTAEEAAEPSYVPWDPQWKHLVCIDTPQGQVTWHMHDSHMHLFSHLTIAANRWDGHTTVEKYERLAKL